MQAQLLLQVSERVQTTHSIAEEIAIASTRLHNKLQQVSIDSEDLMEDISGPDVQVFKSSVKDTLDAGKSLEQSADQMSTKWLDLCHKVNELQNSGNVSSNDFQARTANCIETIRDVQSLSSVCGQRSSIFLERLNELIRDTVSLKNAAEDEARRVQAESRAKKIVCFLGGIFALIPAVGNIIACVYRGRPIMASFAKIKEEFADVMKEYNDAKLLDSHSEKLNNIKRNLIEQKKLLVHMRDQTVGLQRQLTHGQQMTDTFNQIFIELKEAADGSDSESAIRETRALMIKMERQMKAFERDETESRNDQERQENQGGSRCLIL